MTEMVWEKLLSPMRFDESKKDKEDKEDDARSPFQRDYDRIVFSNSFRRLAKKTQVHPLSKNDHTHNRLIHSIEVSSVGRSLGTLVGKKIEPKLPKDIIPDHLGQIVSAACLAHDIGNPPFGHAGEEVIKAWFVEKGKKYLRDLKKDERADFSCFDGNAQGLRILNKLECYYYTGGMRLTYATLGAFLKYPYTSTDVIRDSTGTKKMGIYQTEIKSFKELIKTTGIVKKKGKYCRHPLVYLTEAADDICYGILDLEDACELGIVDYQKVEDLLLPICEGSDLCSDNLSKKRSDSLKVSYLRAKAIDNLTKNAANSFLENERGILKGDFEGSLINNFSEEMLRSVKEIKNFSKKEIYQTQRKSELEVGAYSTLGNLLEIFCDAVQEKLDKMNKRSKKCVTFKTDKILSLMGKSYAPKEGDSHYEAYMKIVDYISGMTDDYALYLANQFAGVGKH
jgi:dGTPase